MHQVRKTQASRSHCTAACFPCRRRKSRCKFDDHSGACLMCLAHDTECVLPNNTRPARSSRRARDSPNRRNQIPVHLDEPDRGASEPLQNNPGPVSEGSSSPPPNEITVRENTSGVATTNSSKAPEITEKVRESTQQPLPLDEAGVDDSPHIVGPAIASDRQFLNNYLSNTQSVGSARTVRPVLPGLNSGPVVFTRVPKKPIGVDMSMNPAYSKLHTIEKLLEPCETQIINLYFTKYNRCFPILDEISFRDHYCHAKSRISPAVLACLYSIAMIFWQEDQELRSKHVPDGRFVWNLALDALYSELHLSPGISSVIAILLNVGGRPTTTMIGNGMLLGSAISLAHSLGLNRNPLPWDIPEPEKHIRMRIWWCLVIHDRWSSLAYGTPPHVRRAYYDVTLPKNGNPDLHEINQENDGGNQVFETLASLTEVLGSYLEHLYCIGLQNSTDHITDAALDSWVDSLKGEMRQIILRGTNLSLPGAANLRLCFLAAKFFCRRLVVTQETGDLMASQAYDERYVQVRRAAEEIVLLIDELTTTQLGDFWLPMAAFILASTAAFLIRFAVQSEIPAVGPLRSQSLSLARDLMDSLRSHKENNGWDLGDLALNQCAEAVVTLLAEEGNLSDTRWEVGGLPIPDSDSFNYNMANLWDPLLWGEGAMF